MAKYEKGKIVKGVVSGIEAYGAFVALDEYYTGLIHISEISHGYVRRITDYINIGDIINVGKTKKITIKACIPDDIDTALLPTTDTPTTLTFKSTRR